MDQDSPKTSPTARSPRPAWVPLAFALLAVALCCTLGVWQLSRMQQKNALIEARAAAAAQSTLGTLPEDASAWPPLAYRHAVLTGRFLPEKTLRFVARKVGGYVLLSPFRLEESDRVILVARGWFPADPANKDAAEPPPEGVMQVEGHLRPARERRYFSPDNDAARNLWFTETLPEMEQVLGTPLSPLVLDAEPLSPLRNDHLGYAITWFMLAGVAVAMTLAYRRKEARA